MINQAPNTTINLAKNMNLLTQGNNCPLINSMKTLSYLNHFKSKEHLTKTLATKAPSL